MKAALKRILVYLICSLVLTACNGAALKSLREIIKRVPSRELVRRVPKKVPKSGKKSPKWTRGIDDIYSAISRNDSTLFLSPVGTPKNITPKYNRRTNSFNPGVNAPFESKTIDVTITAPMLDVAPNYSDVNPNRNSRGYRPNPFLGTSTQLQLKTYPRASFSKDDQQ